MKRNQQEVTTKFNEVMAAEMAAKNDPYAELRAAVAALERHHKECPLCSSTELRWKPSCRRRESLWRRVRAASV